ncbi:conjugative transposon TraM protein [Parabacteroides sp. PF5-5]|nr:conjugative transposon TraM protein [Parabacteroides sp. PH5-39]MDH6317085.1 conjugative transposon TraM protein [Parabacteroides sp. PF5-13]MDH6320838.1 conjugative transposon TraM protein [Parabacteroides sp. PH5-13]MDH6324460.1 conjugative transposon TraM protein [Parabacteroides sp. PH5-8]MDH6328270.1 conjugative transposon TraM protein [Parabacteroides sp. PH5-41]MDH6336072.1 conjugative transposon TraM protein [Parabacteroides sp. PF5-5]MDH6347027.1 conjugative transposon TraM protei
MSMSQQNNNEGQKPQEAPAPEVKQEVKKEPPKSASGKKELTPAQMQKRRKMLVMPLFFLLFAGAMWLIFAPSKKEGDQATGQDGFNSEIPTPKDEGIYTDKRTAYEQEAMRQREQEKMRSLQDFSTMFEQTEEQNEGQIRIAPEPPEYYENPELSGGNSSRTRGNSIQSSAAAYQDINKQLGSWYEEQATVDDGAQLAVEARVEELERRLEEAEAEKAAQDEQTALLEKSYQMAAKYMPQGAQQTADETAIAATSRDKVNIQPVRQVHHNVVSLLTAPMEDQEFIDAWSQPRNMGFYTAAGNEGIKDKNSIRACVNQTITLTSGKELQIRLLEPMIAGNIRIPANTILVGACRIGNERMEVTINSIHYAGNIIPVELQVYDLDGQRGISVPGSDEINAAKEIASQMAQSAGSSITITDDAGSQFAADMGKSLIQGASQYVSKKMSVVKVTLKANYQLLLLPKTQ